MSVGFSLYPCGRVATLKQLLRIVHTVAKKPLYSFDIFPELFWHCIADMTLVSDLAAASAHVYDSAKLSSDDYDRRLRELVEYLRRLLSTKALDTLANDESILDVSGSCFIARMDECLIELLLTFVFLSSCSALRPSERFYPISFYPSIADSNRTGNYWRNNSSKSPAFWVAMDTKCRLLKEF